MRPAHLATTSARILLGLLALAVVVLVGGCDAFRRTDVLILVRANDPVSRAIADYYADARDIARSRILELPLSGPGDANEIDVATFETEIATPLEAYLAEEDPDAEIALLVTTRGVPLRIGHCATDQPGYPRHCKTAAVDAALAGLGRVPVARSLSQVSQNPFFRDSRSFARFRIDEPGSALRFLVARLTGPGAPLDAETGVPVAIRSLIDRGPTLHVAWPPLWRVRSEAPRAARTAAAAVLLDPIRERLVARGQRVCDGCGDAGETDAATGIVYEHVDAAGAASSLVPSGLVVALGGPPSEFRRRSSDPPGPEAFDRFVATTLAEGAGALSAHLGEPSLAGVTRPAVALRSWARGESAVEAHFKSVPHLGWLNVFIGDPLLVLTVSDDSNLPDATPRSATPASAPPPARAADRVTTRTVAIASAVPSDTTVGEEDRDGDGIVDSRDNCLDIPNPLQRDTNGDRIGNRCDPDVDNDGRVETSWGRIYPRDERGDLEAIALTARNGPFNPDHDLDGDGRVDERDLAIAQLWLFRAPGPSGYARSTSEAPDPLAAALDSPRNISIRLDVSRRPEPER